MASTPPRPAEPTPPARPLDPLAGLLSYLVPGLGQIYRRRYAKGLLFLVCIYVLFFYGNYIGSGSIVYDGRTYRLTGNVYLPNEKDKGPVAGVFNRWQYAGQFPVGVAAWPALAQYYKYDHEKQDELEDAQKRAGREALEVERFEQSAKDLERRIADGEKGEGNENLAEQLADARRRAAEAREAAGKAAQDARDLERTLDLPLVGSLQREPSPAAVNAVHNAGDKRLELAWVFTVIAGVLNVLVIYDAAVGAPRAEEKKAA